MSESATLARPYANALFNVSKENSLDFSDSLLSLIEVVSDKNFKNYLKDPSISKKFICDFISEIMQEEKTSEFKSFILILIENSRLLVLNEIYHQYKTLMNSADGIKKVKIISAFKLAEQELISLVNKLEHKYKTKLEPDVAVDPTLLGGVRIEIGDQVLDGSVKSRIDRLKSSLLSWFIEVNSIQKKLLRSNNAT